MDRKGAVFASMSADEMADKQKAVPEEAVSRPLRDCFLRYKCHIETLKSSKIVVNYVKIVVLRGFRG